MKKLSLLFFLMTPLAMTNSLHAVTYPFWEHEQSSPVNETIIKVGSELYLFHSGTEEVEKTIKINDVLSVYREFPPDISTETREVGKVRILSPLGENFFEAEVIEGEVTPGCVAKKGTIACYVTSFEKRGRH
jgi:hypothetical protein